jgi:ribosomal protein S18 acetylase RimI-like enzyme
MQRMLDNLIPLKGCATLYHEGQVVAVGLGVVDQGYIGLFDIVTAPELRRKGFGRRVVLALLNWGKENGATQAYLQVVPTNMPAINLYAGLGFREVYEYRYRTKP